MKRIPLPMNFSRVMGWILLSLLVFPPLVGCTRQPTISEGELYLQATAEKVQLEAYRKQLLSSRERLTAVLPQLQTLPSEMPPSQLGSLASYLLANDCTEKSSQADQLMCWRVMRVVLINTTRALDDSNAKVYAGQRTIAQLVENLNGVIDGLAPPEVEDR